MPATVSTTVSGMRPRCSPPCSHSRAVDDRTTLSVPAYTVAKRSSKVRRIVSVKTRVPVRKAMPRITESPVLNSLRLFASVDLSAIRSISGSEALQLVEDPRHGRVFELANDATVGEEDDSVGVARRSGVVGDHDDGLAIVVDGAADHLEHLGGR